MHIVLPINARLHTCVTCMCCVLTINRKRRAEYTFKDKFIDRTLSDLDTESSLIESLSRLVKCAYHWQILRLEWYSHNSSVPTAIVPNLEHTTEQETGFCDGNQEVKFRRKRVLGVRTLNGIGRSCGIRWYGMYRHSTRSRPTSGNCRCEDGRVRFSSKAKTQLKA